MKKHRIKLGVVILISVIIFGLMGVYTMHNQFSFAEPVDGEQTEETTPGEEEELPPWQPEEEEPSAPAEEEEPYEPEVSTPESTNSSTGNGDGQTEETTPENAIDTRLWGLSISCGTFVPEFSSDIYEYTVYVTKDQEEKSCEIIAEPVDAMAEVTIEGPETFTDQDIEKRVILTGPAGEKSEYVIKIHVAKETELVRNNQLYVISNEPELKKLPEGFSKQEITYRGEKITAAQSKDGNLIMVQYNNAADQSDVLWYRLDTANEKLYPAKLSKVNGEICIIISENRDFLYGESGQGRGYYVYNPETKTTEFILAEGVSEVKAASFPNAVKILMGVLIVVTLLSISAVVLMHRKYKKQVKKSKAESKYFRPYISLADSRSEQGKKEE